jgi:hypothetical protein
MPRRLAFTIIRKSKLNSASGLVLKTIQPGHAENGRSVRARTADLDRVNRLVKTLGPFV